MQTRSRRRAAVRVQRWWRDRLRHRDPITLGPVRDPVWVEGTLFGRAALRAYVRRTGDTRNPVTRRPLTRRVLARLGVTRIRTRRRREAARQQRRALLEYLEREVHGLGRRVIETVGAPESVGVAILQLLQTLFPNFQEALRDLARAGGDARAAVEACLALLQQQTVAPGHLSLYMVASGFFTDMIP